MMKFYVLALPIVFLSAAQAADTDTLCATVYTFLAESARYNGMSEAGFEDGVNKAQLSHLVNYPTDDPQHYALNVIDGAQTIRDGLARGTITSDSVIAAATSCNARYYEDPQSAQAGRSR